MWVDSNGAHLRFGAAHSEGSPNGHCNGTRVVVVITLLGHAKAGRLIADEPQNIEQGTAEVESGEPCEFLELAGAGVARELQTSRRMLRL
ncbi:MAG: hypothetical protein C0404_01240 [Verrucomicrobia bacterium]|nr:hypothetical protein [Verrucomicrobiota bacterium]